MSWAWATISDRPYEVTAEMMEPGQANFIARDALTIPARIPERWHCELRSNSAVTTTPHMRKSSNWV